jgi:hypothetical protein
LTIILIKGLIFKKKIFSQPKYICCSFQFLFLFFTFPLLPLRLLPLLLPLLLPSAAAGCWRLAAGGWLLAGLILLAAAAAAAAAATGWPYTAGRLVGW